MPGLSRWIESVIDPCRPPTAAEARALRARAVAAATEAVLEELLRQVGWWWSQCLP